MQKTDQDFGSLSELCTCPVCSKVFTNRKQMYLHIMKAHKDGQTLSYDFQADLYQRWQERIPRPRQ